MTQYLITVTICVHNMELLTIADIFVPLITIQHRPAEHIRAYGQPTVNRNNMPIILKFSAH